MMMINIMSLDTHFKALENDLTNEKYFFYLWNIVLETPFTPHHPPPSH
jgi:hypothetical protein